MRRFFLASVLLVAASPVMAAPPTGPNVLFIAIDDLRDWVGFLGNRQARTPNLDKLAERGVVFTHSYCAAPVCSASRTALMSGLRPSSSGIYENDRDWRTTTASDVIDLTKHLRNNGYGCIGAGKIYHSSFPAPADYWDDYEPASAIMARTKEQIPHESAWGFGNFLLGPLASGDDSLTDYHAVSSCLEQLKQKARSPFFLACGLAKPHLPWRVPQKYFDMYPLDAIKVPVVCADDLVDIPATGRKLAHQRGDHATITKAGRWKEAVQSYLAAISYCDAQVGRLIDGLDASDHRDSTIIILWSDHGWSLGEKEHWRKFALWEEPTRSPLVFVVPGMTQPGSRCRRTVDFMSIYPTVCDLCGIPTPPHVQGQSLVPLLKAPDAKWSTPAVMTYGLNNHAVRSEKWRYIRYSDGGEELYDHEADPNEWTNLADNQAYATVKENLAKWMPVENLPDARPSVHAVAPTGGR